MNLNNLKPAWSQFRFFNSAANRSNGDLIYYRASRSPESGKSPWFKPGIVHNDPIYSPYEAYIRSMSVAPECSLPGSAQKKNVNPVTF